MRHFDVPAADFVRVGEAVMYVCRRCTGEPAASSGLPRSSSPARWKRNLFLLTTATLLGAGTATSSSANDTVIYTYDALGRLVSISIAGGPRGGQQISTGFDPADNRTNYQVTGAPSSVFSIADVSVNEGGTATLTVSRFGASSGSATVSYATSNGSATAPADYTATSGTLTFADGETSKTVTAATIDDTYREGPETFGVTLSNASAGTGISRASATVTIIDNDLAPKLAISGASVTEGGAAVLTVTRSSVINTGVSVNYATSDGTAVAPGDYTATSGTLTFVPGETSKTITVATVDDGTYETTESFSVGLSGATDDAVITNATGTVTVNDNDAAPSFSILGGSAAEGGSITFTVTKSGATTTAHSVTYDTADGTATAADDYARATGTLTFLPGETSKIVTVPTVDDTVYEQNETFQVRLSGATGGATISTTSATGTITDNDAAPSFSVSNVAITEGGTASVTVTKSGSTNVNASVSFATVDGTATQSDYNPVSGSLTFLPGETAKSVQITTKQNSYFDTGTSFNLQLSNPSDATLGNSNAVVTINNDDPPPTFTVIANAAKPEGSPVSFGVVLGGNTSYRVPLTVNYTTSSGTATSGVDFTPTSGTLTFISPGTVQTVSVPTVQDTDYEPDETVNFTISSPSYGATIEVAQASGTILNDDPAPSQGPVANTDSMGTYARCASFTVAPLANDSDPGGHYPLSLVSVATGSGYDRVVNGNTVTFTALAGGAKSVLYVMQNSIGQQASAAITFTVQSGKVCP